MNMNEQIHLVNIDSKVGMKELPNKSIDLVLTDPPYGIADKSKMTKYDNKFMTTHEAWGNDFKDQWTSIDEYYEWLKPFISEFVRVLKDDGSLIMFLDRKYTGAITFFIERDFEINFKNKIYFKKTNPVPSLRKNNYRSSMEECIWLTKGKQYCFNFGEQSEMTQVYEGPIGHKDTKHPNEKYKWMIEPLIKNHSKPGDIILDAFAGSGTTIHVAKQNNRNAIGFEMNEKFYEMAKNRCIKEQLEIKF